MLKSKKINFFTGKGGVGKSTLSFAFAKYMALKGHKTLWLEFTQNVTEKPFEKEVGFTPVKLRENLFVSSWTGEDCLQEFVKYSVKLRLIYETFYRSKAITALIKAAPALREIAFLGYLTSHLRGVKPALDFDQIVIDAPSTGHFLSCLKVPQALLEISDFGPMGFHCRGILDVLKDESKTTIYNICQLEPLIINEHNELNNELHQMGFKSVSWINKSYPKKLILELESIPPNPSRKLIEELRNQVKFQVDWFNKNEKSNFIKTNFGNIESVIADIESYYERVKVENQ